jgi:DNA-binding LacI/PurR family transcriptional regulator
VGYFTLDPSPQFLADPGRSALLSGVADVLREQDYCLLVQALPPEGPSEPFHRLYKQRRFDGAVLDAPDRFVEPLLQAGCPCVLVEGQLEGQQAARVRADNRQGAAEVVDYLQAKGHKRIDLFTVEQPWPNMEERRAGYQAALQAHRLRIPPPLTAASEHVESARTAMEKALRRGRALTAVFCINDLLALGALQAAKAVGRHVPGELAVVGFGDFAFSQYLEPPLTTVVLPKYEMGRRAAELLLGYFREGRFAERDVVFATRLLSRESA